MPPGRHRGVIPAPAEFRQIELARHDAFCTLYPKVSRLLIGLLYAWPWYWSALQKVRAQKILVMGDLRDGALLGAWPGFRRSEIYGEDAVKTSG